MTKILSQKEVCHLTTLTRQTIRNLERRGDFPTRIALTPGPRGRKGWDEVEIQAWLAKRPRGFVGRHA